MQEARKLVENSEHCLKNIDDPLIINVIKVLGTESKVIKEIAEKASIIGTSKIDIALLALDSVEPIILLANLSVLKA